ncbi:MAG: acyltransferase domain-containing protein, partial [Acidobacteria bacterium]|nr:acyltransferase domain-containing protein [Acidobacteriota bacterium]
TGKIDRKTLSLIEIEPLKPAPTQAAPQTGLEKCIAAVWQETLGRSDISIYDNLLEIGGNSFDIIKINSKLSELLHEHIPIVKSFEYPTIKELANYLQHRETTPPNTPPNIPSNSPNTAKQRGISLEIAVIGMAGRFPGAANIDEFWENLKNGIESISFFTEEELIASGLPSELVKHPNYIKAKGMIADMEFFDAAFFNFTPAEAVVMDPQLRIFLECCWETFEHAGYNPTAYDGAVGVYAGNAFNIGWLALVFSQTDSAIDEFEKGILNNHISTYISYKLNLTGPSVAIRTACSTSLVAVHEACKGLLLNECDMALAGGVSLLVPKKAGYLYQEGMIYSADGHVRSFDAQSKGTVFGDGVGCVLLKRLPDAIDDGDTIYAVIKGSAVNNDGVRKPGYTASSTAGQRDVVRAAQIAAKCDPETISFIETHGAGTILGDAVEIEALKQVFPPTANKYCALASVKSNVGHLNSAAGIAGFIKTVLSLKYELIPPSLHFETPNPEIDFTNSPFYVNTRLIEWKNKKPLRAGVSSFGIGGTNAHVVLEEYQGAFLKNRPAGTNPQKTFHMLLLSAKSPFALEQLSGNIITYLSRNPGIDFNDVTYTLQMGRPTFRYKKMLVCSTPTEAITELTKNTKKVKTSSAKIDPPPIIFIISGQGGQYVNMGRDLYNNEPLFRREMDRSFEIIKPLLNFDLKDVLYNTGQAPNNIHIDQPEIALAVNFIFQYSLAQFLMKLGITPTAMSGYSFGEYAAACLAGVLTWEEALKLIFARGLLMRETSPGAMLSVPLSEHEIRPLMHGSDLSLAINNGSSCVVAGTIDDVKNFEKQMREKRSVCITLNMSHAAHSSLMNPIRKSFEEKVRQVKLNNPQIPYISNVTGTWITNEQAVDPTYWGEHLCSTVQFSKGINELLKITNAVFIEIGPGRLLSNIIRQSLTPETPSNHKIINMIKHQQEKQPDDYYFWNQLGELWLHGVPIDWRSYYNYKNEKHFRMPLPTYPFDKKRFWLEAAGPSVKLENSTANIEITGQITYPYESDNENYEAPRDELETNIAAVWEKILGLNRIGIHDNFYDMNGDSLTATQMTTRLQEIYPIEIPLRDFLERPTIAQLAELIKDLLVQKLAMLSGEELDALNEEDLS